MAALAWTPAAAAPAPAPAPAAVEEVIVTGTRLPNADLTADSPIVTLDAQRLRDGGTLTLDTALNRLPQVVPSFSSAANNPAVNGASYVDLRGLGVSRNLVLLDGRRVVGSDASNSVDLNTIPQALIDRVEVVTGGASAVYGADAVAGVVNVILKRRFDGVEVQGRTLLSQRGDGREHELALTAGHDFARGSLMASLGWARRDEIGKGARPFSAQADTPSGFLPGGAYLPSPGALPSQAAVDAVFGGYGVAPGAVSQRGGIGGFGFNADGTLIATGRTIDPAFDAQNYRGPLGQVAARFYPDVYSFNFQPFNKLILPLDRDSAFLSGTYDLTDRVSLYARAMGARYTTATALAPTPAPTDANPLYPGLGLNAFTIPVSNPFIPPDLARLLASRTGNSPALAGSGPGEEFQYRIRAVALGARRSDNRAEAIDLAGGIKAELGGDWRADVSLSFGRYGRRERQDGLLSVRRMEQLLDSPTGGTEFCAGGFDPFGGEMSQACRQFLRVTAGYSTRVRQADAQAVVSGSLWRLPAGAVRAVFGAESRDVDFRFVPPGNLSTGEVAGFFFLDSLEGRIRTRDLFTEVAIPLLADRPWARAANLTLGWRRSDERGGRAVDSYKAEVSWLVAAPLRLRGSFQRAVRAPDIFERFQPALAGGAQAIDPCSMGNPGRTAAILAFCERQALALGFLASDADAFDQGDPFVPVINAGNTALSPEKARTVTLGAVWEPGWRSDLVGNVHATVDGYDIAIDNAIGYLDPQLVLNACYGVGGGNVGLDLASSACSGVMRSSGDFSLSSVQSPETNQGALDLSGIDAALGFRTDLAALSGRAWLGRIDASLSVSWLRRFRQQISPIQPRYDYAGTIADGGTGYETLPRWKGLLDVAWTSGPVKLAVSGRFIDAMEHRLRRIGADPTATGVGAAAYWDLLGQWAIGRRADLRAGVLNLLDRAPELYTPAVDAGTEPSTYDVIGRRFWLGLTFRY